jgi:hypothetical protein
MCHTHAHAHTHTLCARRHGWPDVDLVVGDLEGTEKVVLGEGDGQGKGLGWLRRVHMVALKLAPGQSHLGASRLLGSAFVRCGHAVHHQFWCRVSTATDWS